VATDRPRIGAVILTYNCAPLLARAYERIPKDLVDDVIVMDDGSKDDAAGAAEKLGLPFFRNASNLGYGGNLKAGFSRILERGAEYVVEVHGDGQFDAGALRLALPFVRSGADLILGSRFVEPWRALKNGMSLARFLANRGLSLLDRLVLRLPLTEFHTGFRVYSRRFLETTPWQTLSDDYLFSFQIIAQAAYEGAKTAEVPVDADYLSDHTSVSLSRSVVYAFGTMGVLGRFLAARLGLRHDAVFPRRA
jgi:glycosyltransferase involved in cell wall biosynthesis